MPQVQIFVDYDNLLPPQKTNLLSVVSTALLKHSFPAGDLRGRCDVRFYGGWYEGTNLTPLAQDVSNDIQRDFPAVLPALTKQGEQVRFSVSAEMAYALSEEPTHHLLDTFRQKQIPNNFKPKNPISAGCTASSCVLGCLPPLFKKQKCPQVGCHLTLQDVFVRNEQKLVDTMLTCDIIHAARPEQGNSLLIVMSGDDDLLPATRTALLRGVSVLRLHPRPSIPKYSFPVTTASFVEDHL